MTLKVALTGGIACGKSVIGDAFVRLKVKLIDTDVISRELVTPKSPLLYRIKELFGPQVLTSEGTLDRSLLRQLVFSDPKALTRLNALMHPAILERVRRALEALQEEPYVVVAVPLLFELNWQGYFDRILVADCEREVQLQRLIQRDGITLELAEKMLCEQVSRERRRSLAQDLIETDRLSLVEISKYVLKLDAEYRKLARAAN